MQSGGLAVSSPGEAAAMTKAAMGLGALETQGALAAAPPRG
jgi:hypothetical protein